MVEVFRTNVNCPEKARHAISKIHKQFSYIHANFDLEDCDKILRIEFSKHESKVNEFLSFIETLDIYAEILPD